MATMTSKIIKSAPNDCTKCELHLNRTQVVYPDVLRNSEDEIQTLVIGEAPGAKEDEQGKPFVGASGKLLRKELARIPGRVIITNTVKCRPPENRNPRSTEKKACNEFLQKELDFYKPDIILLVGRISSSLYLDTETLKSFSEISGTLFKDKYIPILHPASTMYNGKKNKPIWEESWKKVLAIIKTKFPESHEILPKITTPEKQGKKKGLLEDYM